MSQFQTGLQRHGILGRGKLAQHWAFYLRELGLSVWHWEEARTLKDGFYSQIPGTTHLWMLLSDSALALVHERLKAGLILRRMDASAMTLLHASAATSVPGLVAVHPLMTFGLALYAPETYRSIPLVTFDSEIDADGARRLLSAFPNPQVRLPAQARGLYHALCSMSANFAQILWESSAQLAQRKIGLPPAAFGPLIRQSAENYARYGAASLTGPLVRGDQATLEKHLASLKGQPLEHLYRAYLRAFAEMPADPERSSHDHGPRV